MSRLLLLLALLAGLSCFTGPIRNPDLYWHLHAAEEATAENRMPSAEAWSHTIAGTPWVDFEWLPQLLYHGLMRAAGPWALLALRLLTIAAVLLVAARLLALRGMGPGGQALGVLFAAVVICPYGDLRPDNFSLLFFSLLLLGLEAKRLGVLVPDWRHHAAAAALFSLWSSTHLGLLYGLVLAALYGELRLLGFCVLGSLANPHGWQVFTVVPGHMDYIHTLSGTICEWRAPLYWAPWMRPFAGLLAASGLAAAWSLWTRKLLPLPHYLALAYYGWAAATHERHLTYFALVAVPLVLPLAKELPARWGWALSAACAGHAVLVIWPLMRGPVLEEPAKDMAAFLQEHKAALGGRKLYNSWEDGGYLGWKLYPDYRIFYDGRYLFHGLLERTKAAAQSAPRWTAFMDRHGVDVACFRRSNLKPRYERRANGMVKRPYYLDYYPEKEWALVFWDLRKAVVVRRKAVDEKWLAAHELKVFRPDDSEELGRLAALGKLPPPAEIERQRAQAPAAFEEIDGLARWLDQRRPR